MRVMLVHNRYRSVAPSGETAVVEREGKALADLGHEVIWFERSSDEIEHWSRAKKATLPARMIWSQEAHRDMAAALREHRPDVVHVHNTFPLLSPSILYASRDARVPVVASIHNKRLMCANGAFFRNGTVCHDCADGSALRGVVHGCYRGSRAASASVVLATSVHRRSWRSLVSAYVFASASQRDLLTGLDLPTDRVFVKSHVIPRKEMRSVVRGPNVMYAGRLEEAKGVRVLMAGWDSYRRGAGEPGLGLVIAGGGDMQAEVAAWASSRPSVEMVGRVDDARFAELMSGARAILLPSTCEETFGLVVVEAMAAGSPPVAAAHGALAELITPGVDGMLFRPGDPEALGLAIADVEARPGQYQIYGAQARETYEKQFDPDRIMEQLLEIYRYAMEHPIFG
ncbi:MAG TPA: glycosyltransferase [Streptosporangiaceae bacterium]|nr:glycosyltransferase [Streptosporangiaceae bacterium]HLN67458.1 glycosyltransferase [Streptosporangiaceae bacterium]